MFVSPTPGFAINQVRRELAIKSGDGQQFERTHTLRGATLIHVDVGGSCADHGTPPRQHRGERDHIGSRAIERGERLRLAAKVALEDLVEAGGVDVIAIGAQVAVVCLGDRRENLGMDPRVVVRGEGMEVRIMETGHRTIFPLLPR